MAYASERQVQLAMPTPSKLFTPAVTTLLILMAAGYALISWAPDFTQRYLCLYPWDVVHGRVWELVTYTLVGYPPNLIFDMLIVLFVGSAIEREWGTPSFVKLWIVTSIGCAVLWILASLVYSPLTQRAALGSGACTYGLLGAFALIFRGQRLLVFFWSMQAQHLALLLIAIGVIVSIGFLPNLIWVSGAGVAYLYVRLIWALKRPRLRNAAAPDSNRFKDLG